MCSFKILNFIHHPPLFDAVLSRCLFRSFWWCHWNISPWKSYGLGTGWSVGLLTVLTHLTSARKHRCMSIWQHNYFYYWIFYSTIRPWCFGRMFALLSKQQYWLYLLYTFGGCKQDVPHTRLIFIRVNPITAQTLWKMDKYENLLKKVSTRHKLVGSNFPLIVSNTSLSCSKHHWSLVCPYYLSSVSN